MLDRLVNSDSGVDSPRESWLTPRRAILLSAAAVILVRLASSAAMAGPVIMEDELGPFGLARFLTGNGPHPQTTYYPGHGLILTGGWLLGSSFEGAYQLSLLTQSLVAGFAAVLCGFAFTRLKPEATSAQVGLVVLLCGFYPAFFIASHFTWTETSVFLSAIGVFAMATTVRSDGRYGGMLGLISGLCVVVHPRLVVIPIAIVLWVLLEKGLPRRAVITGAIVGSGVAIAIAELLAGDQADSYGLGLREGFVPTTWVAIGSGALLVGVISSLGFAPIVLTGSRFTGSLGSCARLSALMWVGMVALGALFFGRGNPADLRADQVIYGRYQDAILPILVVVGVAAFPLVNRWHVLLAGSVTVIGSGAAVLLILGNDTLNRVFIPYNVVGLGTIGPMLTVLGLVGLGLVVAVLPVVGIAIRRPFLFHTSILVLFIAISFGFRNEFVVSRSMASASAVAPAELIEEATVRDDTCVLVDLDEGSFWYRAMYEYRSGVRTTIGRADASCRYEYLVTDESPPPNAKLLANAFTGVALYELDEG